MNKAEFVEKISKKMSVTKSSAEHFVDAAVEIIQETVAKGDEVKIVGFGTFDQSLRQKRNGRNPKTGQPITIPASRVPRFRPGKDFRSRVDV